MHRSILLALFALYGVFGKQPPILQIRQGDLVGKYEQSWKGREFSAFTGIPYAKPPLNDLRFRAPVAAEPWTGVLDATQLHAVCPQTNVFRGDFEHVIGSEDCLYLNVYTPQELSSKDQLLPVMFYVHGGAFLLGSANSEWYGPEKFMDKDIVLVLPNYRLGALGFLSTTDKEVPGNNGLKDLVLALRWTKENIAAFGGDPEKITVAGHSAGAALVHYLMLSPLSRDLIKGTIAQSGTTLNFWAINKNSVAKKNAEKLAQSLSCLIISSKEMVECLRKKDVADILKQSNIYLEWAMDPLIPFRPVVEVESDEEAFISEHPRDIIKSGKLPNIPFVTGITTEDGAIRASGYCSNPIWIDDLNNDFNRVNAITLEYKTNKEEKGRKIRNFYLKEKEIDNSTKDELAKMYTDMIFFMGMDESVKLHAKYNNQKVYSYLFGFRGSKSFSEKFGDTSYNYGVCHGDELFYLFTLKKDFPDYVPDEKDIQMMDVLTTLWANFVITGNPTPDSDLSIFPKWESVSSEGEDFKYLFINSTGDIGMAEGFYSERSKFLRELDLYSINVLSKTEL